MTVRLKKNAVSEIKYSRSRVSIIPREIDVKCWFALMNARKLTIGPGRKIRNSLIIVRTMQIMNAVKNAII